MKWSELRKKADRVLKDLTVKTKKNRKNENNCFDRKRERR